VPPVKLSIKIAGPGGELSRDLPMFQVLVVISTNNVRYLFR